MNTYPTLVDARIKAKSTYTIKSIIEIQHRTLGNCFLCLSCNANDFINANKVKPIPDILKIIVEHPRYTTEELEEITSKNNNTIEITLSSRGWGDYSNCTYYADLRKNDTELIAGCRKELNDAIDVDNKNLSDSELLEKISAARLKHADSLKPIIEEEPKGNGYCYSCKTYCCGDCGCTHNKLNPIVKDV